MKDSATVLRPAAWVAGMVLILCCLLGSTPATAQVAQATASLAEQGSSSEAELSARAADFQGKLGDFVGGLDGLNGIESADVLRLEEHLPDLSAEQLLALEESTGGLPHWERLPEVLGNIEHNRELGRERLVARVAESRVQLASVAETAGDGLEQFRGDYLFFVESLRAFSPMIESPDFEARIDAIKDQIAGIPDEHLDRLRQNYYHNAPAWMLQIENKVSANLIPTIPTISCSFGCPCDFGCPCTEICAFGSCSTICEPFCTAAEATCNLACDGITAICSGLNSLIGEINGLINSINSFLQSFVSTFEQIFSDIAAFPSTIENFFLGLWDDIRAGLQAAFDAFIGLLPEPDEVLDFILQPVGGTAAVSNSSFWNDFANGFFQGATLSVDCGLIGLAIDDNVPGFGVVGGPRAEYVCKRGIDFADELIWDYIPDDVKGTPVKLPYALLVHYPIKFFCTCLETQSAISFQDAQLGHRGFASQVLDQEISTIARESDLTALLSDATVLDNSQLAAVQAAVNQARSQMADLDGDVVVVDGQVDDVGTALDEQQDLVAAIEALTVRIRIEESLIHEEGAVALFQGTELTAGFLSKVREIVVDTIANTSDAREDVWDAVIYLQQGDSLLQEGFFEKTFEAYRNAYREAVQETP